MARSRRPSVPPRPRCGGRCSGRSSCCEMRWSRRGWHMQCRTVLTKIDSLRTHELAPIEQTAVEGHLSTCRSCDASRSDVDELADVVKKLAVAPPQSCRGAVCDAVADSFARSEGTAGAVWGAFSDGG